MWEDLVQDTILEDKGRDRERTERSSRRERNPARLFGRTQRAHRQLPEFGQILRWGTAAAACGGEHRETNSLPPEAHTILLPREETRVGTGDPSQGVIASLPKPDGQRGAVFSWPRGGFESEKLGGTLGSALGPQLDPEQLQGPWGDWSNTVRACGPRPVPLQEKF